jgi:hypothetical protein
MKLHHEKPETLQLIITSVYKYQVTLIGFD